MQIIEPKVELWKQVDNITHVAKCARVCYKKDKGNDDKLIEHLKKHNHLSMFRHESVYAIINYDNTLIDILSYYNECPYINYKINYKEIYIATNMNFILDLKQSILEGQEYYKNQLYNFIINNEVTSEYFANTDIGFNMMRYTFCVTTQISTSRELNRVSPNNIAEQSTRYVYEDGTICRPWWLSKESIITYNNFPIEGIISTIYLDSCKNSFKRYKYSIELGLLREDARGMLPLDTATTCVYTYSIDEWRKIIDLRYYGTTGKPHPNAKIIAGLIKNELEQLGYNFK